MADFYMNYSCWIDTGSEANAKRAIKRLEAYQRMTGPEDDENYPNFYLQLDPTDEAPGGLIIYDTDGSGNADHVIAAVINHAKLCKMTGLWGFAWSFTCSQPRPDGFGGGACVIDLAAGRVLETIDCDNWISKLIETTNKARTPDTEPALA